MNKVVSEIRNTKILNLANFVKAMYFIALNFVALCLHTRGRWKFSLVDIKKIFCRSDLWSKISHVLFVQLETFFP